MELKFLLIGRNYWTNDADSAVIDAHAKKKIYI